LYFDWQSFLLRFKNKTTKNAKDNPIKRLYVNQTQPLTDQEKALLQQGISLFGLNFDQISAQLLPHRPGYILAKFWRRMRSKTTTITTTTTPLSQTQSTTGSSITNTNTDTMYSIFNWL
jgi:hypothetical protein